MRRGSYLLVSIIVLVELILVISAKQVFADNPLVVDLSWPNCRAKLNNLTPSGIIGVNNGLDYSHNPCLASETQLFHNSYALYLNTGYPGINYGLKYAHYPNNCRLNNALCLAYNYGYNDALYSLRYADAQNVHSFVWWLDVESDNSWTNSYQQNRQSLLGMVAAIKNNTFMPTIGYYSYPGQWQSITKDWKNSYPDWVATGLSSQTTAKSYCRASFTGGGVWLSQYTTSLDYSDNCLPNTVNGFRIR